jgi:alanine dehydrogenase
MAIREILSVIKEVKVFDKDEITCKRYAEEIGTKLNLSIQLVKTIEEATEADIVVTTTPSRALVVRKKDVDLGTHINAIGADAKGKQELETDLLRIAGIIVDDIEQASHSGEINVRLSEGVIKIQDIWGTLGEIVAKVKEGRKNDKEITIFDSTGLAIHDIACAKFVYEKAKRIGNGRICKI